VLGSDSLSRSNTNKNEYRLSVSTEDRANVGTPEARAVIDSGLGNGLPRVTNSASPQIHLSSELRMFEAALAC